MNSRSLSSRTADERESGGSCISGTSTGEVAASDGVFISKSLGVMARTVGDGMVHGGLETVAVDLTPNGIVEPNNLSYVS